MNKCALLKYRGHPGLNQGPVDLQSNALPLSYITTNMVTNNTTQLYNPCLLMNKCAVLKYKTQGLNHPGLNQGPVDLQSNALPLSNILVEYGNK